MSLCLASVLSASLALTGCGSSESTSSSTSGKGADTSSPVELNMYLIGSPAKDYDAVLAKFNETAKKDLNCTVKVNWIGFGDFSTKYPLVLASGENIDLIYTSTWLNYYQQAQKGAFMALDEIGPKYAPKSFEAEPKEALKPSNLAIANAGHL